MMVRVGRFNRDGVPDILDAIAEAGIMKPGAEISFEQIGILTWYRDLDCVPFEIAEAAEALIGKKSMRDEILRGIERRFGVKLITVSKTWFEKRRRPADPAEAVKYIPLGNGKRPGGWIVYEAGNKMHEMMWEAYHQRRTASISGQGKAEINNHIGMIEQGMDPEISARIADDLSAINELLEEVNQQVPRLNCQLSFLPSGVGK